MILNSLRLLALIILSAIIIIKDIPLRDIFKNARVQLYIAILCMAILIIIDNITGFILTLGVLIIYFRIYSDEIKKKNELAENQNNNSENTNNNSENTNNNSENTNNNSEKHKTCNSCTMDVPTKKNLFNTIIENDCYVPYITEEHLLAAQTNIIDSNNYNLNIENSDLLNLDIKRGPLYKIQGLPNISDSTEEINHIRGYDISNEYLGTLSYDIL